MKVLFTSLCFLLFSTTFLVGQNEKQYFHNGQLYHSSLVFQNGIVYSGGKLEVKSINKDSRISQNIELIYDNSTKKLDTIKLIDQAKVSFSFKQDDFLKGDFELELQFKLDNSRENNFDFRKNRRNINRSAFLIGLRDSELDQGSENTQFIGLVLKNDNQRIQSSRPFLYAFKGRQQMGSVVLEGFSKQALLNVGVRKVGKVIEYLKDGRPFASFELNDEAVSLDVLTIGTRDIAYSAISEISIYQLQESEPLDRDLGQQPTFDNLFPRQDSIESKYYALIIGNNNYEDPSLQDLDQPISDATKLNKTLISRYQFDSADVTFLKDASRRDMIIALDNLSNKLSEEDNLLIFYAGHGHWDHLKETGYWLPVDAEQGITVDWVRNSTIQGYIENIEAKHILLITDACFAGGIFKTRSAFEDADRSINNLYRYESRKALTFGMLNEVPDRSVFMENLLERLNDNQKKYLSTSALFFSFRENVMNNSDNAPQFGTIHNTGDKGGEFIFILKD